MRKIPGFPLAKNPNIPLEASSKNCIEGISKEIEDDKVKLVKKICLEMTSVFTKLLSNNAKELKNTLK